MKCALHVFGLALGLTLLTVPCRAQDDLSGVIQKILEKKVAKDGDWGLIQTDKKSKKIGVWVYMVEGRSKVHEFDLDIPPTVSLPDGSKEAFVVKKHAKLFKKDQKLPEEREKLTVFTLEQSHVTGIAAGDGKLLQIDCVHRQSALIDLATGKVLASHKDNFVRIIAVKPEQKKEEKKECGNE